jgi:hypothetical protein
LTGIAGGTQVNHAVVFFISGALTVTTTAGKINLYSPFTMTCTEVHVAVNTAPAGAAILVNVLFGGVSIFVTSTEPTIPIGSFTATVTLAGSDTMALAKNIDVTVNIDQVGSTTAGSDLAVQIRCRQ